MISRKVALGCDRIVLFALSLLIFCQPFSKAAIESFFGLAFFFWIIKKISKREYSICHSELDKPLAVFIIINFISVFLSMNFHLSIKAFFGKLLENVIIFIMLIETINTKKRLKIIGMVILASVIMMLADGLVQYIRGYDFLRHFYLENGNKIRASFDTGKGFGGWLAIILIFTLTLALFIKIKTKRLIIFLIILITLLLVSLILSYSRGAWLSFLIGILFISLLDIRKRLYLLGIIAILIPVSFYMVNPQATFQRINLWKEALMIIKDYPLFGTGLNTYTIVAPKYALSLESGIYVHNCYLQMAAETGLAGLITFFWILLILFTSKIKYLYSHKDPVLLGILAGIVVFLSHSFIDVHLYSLQLAVLFWFMLGLAIAVTNIG